MWSLWNYRDKSWPFLSWASPPDFPIWLPMSIDGLFSTFPILEHSVLCWLISSGSPVGVGSHTERISIIVSLPRRPPYPLRVDPCSSLHLETPSRPAALPAFCSLVFLCGLLDTMRNNVIQHFFRCQFACTKIQVPLCITTSRTLLNLCLSLPYLPHL